MTEPGHNSNAQLKALVERIEHVNVEIKDLQTGRAEIYQEAKSQGFDCKALRAVIARRRADAKKLADHEMMVETYQSALG